MNKIIIDKENIELDKVTKKIEVFTEIRNNNFGISKVIINVLSDSDLVIDYNLSNSKYDITFNIMKDAKLNLFEYKKGEKGKIQYTYNLEENSSLYIEKYNDIDVMREMIIVNLNGTLSSIDYNFKSLSTTQEVYDIVVNHNSLKTNSNIKNNAVNIKDGKISFQVSSYVDKGNIGCNVNQSNRIINLTSNKCEIRPNLYIDEFDTNANHSALIGGFSKEELFYIQSRGINFEEASKLLINGFLLSDLKSKKIINEVKESIKEYWR